MIDRDNPLGASGPYPYYILVGTTPVQVASLQDLSAWQVDHLDAFRVARTEIEQEGRSCSVSTVFLFIDHSWGAGPRQLFETMVFSAEVEMEGYTERYATWEEAQAGHRRTVELLGGEYAAEDEEIASTPRR